MDKKEEEILSMHYQIEKTDIKQQRLEDRLLSISEDLKRSKGIRDFYFAFIIILILIIVTGGFYLIQNNMIFSSGDDSGNIDEVEKLLVVNDSLLQEVSRLKADISQQGSNTEMLTDAVLDSITLDTINGESKLDFERIHCYITKIFKSNDAIFIEADFIEYYQGRQAVKKAKEYGEAEYDIDKKGDTLYFLYNNHYIHDQNSKLRILELDDRARVKIENINQISNGFPLKGFQKIIKDKPILILEINNGIVYKISQQKLL